MNSTPNALGTTSSSSEKRSFSTLFTVSTSPKRKPTCAATRPRIGTRSARTRHGRHGRMPRSWNSSRSNRSKPAYGVWPLGKNRTSTKDNSSRRAARMFCHGWRQGNPATRPPSRRRVTRCSSRNHPRAAARRSGSVANRPRCAATSRA